MRLIKASPDAIPAILRQMEEDGGHSVPNPTHIVLNQAGETVGCLSAFYAPCLFMWMDSRKPSGIGAMRAWKLIEALWKELGHDKMLVPVEKSSPFYRYFPSLGLNLLGQGEIHIKTL